MNSQNGEIRFWLSDQPHKSVFDHVKTIRRFSDQRRQSYLYSAVLYDDADYGSMYAMHGWETSSEISPNLALNVVRPNVDMLTTQLNQARPMPMPITNGGNFSQQRRAKQLGQALEGQFLRSGVWETNIMVIRDAILFGTGLVYVYRDGDKVCYDRVFPWEVEIDPRSAMYGKPRTMYLTRLVDKLVLAQRFPKYAKQIEQASNESRSLYPSMGRVFDDDQVVVIEAWHLPSAEGAKDGKHYIVCSNATLLKEDFDYPDFPIIPLYIMPPTFGFFGTGFGRQLMGYQYTTNVLAQRVQAQAELAPAYLMVPNGSDIQIDQLDNSAWPVISHNQGYNPSALVAPSFAPDMWQFVKDVYGMSFDQTGVSQSQAQAEPPSSLKGTPGVTYQMFKEQANSRFNVASKLYEKFCVRVAWRMVDLFDEIVEDGGEVKVSTPTKRGTLRSLQQIDYKKVRMDRDEFILDVYPTTMLKNEPVMRAAQVETFMNSGLINPEEGRVLLDFPDIDRLNDLTRAKFDIVEMIIERMLDEDVDIDEAYTSPEPFFDLQTCLSKATLAYMKAKTDKEPEDRLQLLRTFIDATITMIQETQGGGAPPGAPPAGGAGAPGQPPAPPGGIPAPGAPVPGPPVEGAPVPPVPPEGGGMTPADLAASIGPNVI